MNQSGRPRLLSNADLGKARSMKASGFNASQIAVVLNVSAETMRRRLRLRYKQPERRW